MADTKLSALTAATAGADADLLYLAQGGTSKKITRLLIDQITSTNANAFCVGRQGTTNPVLNVNAATANVVTGLNITGAAAGAGVAVLVTTSGTVEALTIDAASTGTITLNGTNKGLVGFAVVPTAGQVHIQSGAVGTKTLVSQNIASQTANNFEAQNSSGTAYLTIGPDTLTGTSITSNFLNITGTLPTTLTAQTQAVKISITPAGSSAQEIDAVKVNLLAGYTGSQTSAALSVTSATAGTGSNLYSNIFNVAISGVSAATTTGMEVGLYGGAANGNTNFGVVGLVNTAKNSATNIGVFGVGINTGTSPVEIGGYFGLNSAAPTFASCAICADNGTEAQPIALFRDNGTVKVTIADGGFVFIGGTTAPTALLHLGAGTATASTAPLKLTSGTNLTTAEAGAMEYDGTNLYFTRTGTTRENMLVAVDNAAAPSTTATPTFTSYYGGNTKALGDPNRWCSVNILGTVYKIPMYT